MFIDYKFWGHFIFWGKVAGGFVAFATVAGFIHAKLVSPVFNRVKTINETVTLLAENHLPHIQSSLNAQDVVLKTLQTNVEAGNKKIEQFGTDLDNNKQRVDELHTAFLTHLENAPRKRKRASRK